MALKGTNLTTADAAMLNWWLSIPTIGRVLLFIGSVAAFGWTARSVFGEMSGLGARVGAVEDSVRVIRSDQAQYRAKMDAGVMYLACMMNNPAAPACEFIIRDHPQLLNAVRGKVAQ